MISNKAVAQQVGALMLEASGALNEAAAIMAGSDCSEEEKRTLFLATGRAMGEIVTGVLNPLYRSHPELQPPDFMLPEDFTKHG